MQRPTYWTGNLDSNQDYRVKKTALLPIEGFPEQCRQALFHNDEDVVESDMEEICQDHQVIHCRQ